MLYEEKHSFLLSEQLISSIIKKAREFKIPIFSAFLTALLAYIFAFTNKLVNHDEVDYLFSKGATHTSGRWGLALIDTIFPNVSMPWIYGVITISLITVAICIIIRIFSIRNTFLQGLLACSITAFPALIGTFSYMFTSSSYGMAFLLAILAVWFISRPSLKYAVPAMICAIGSLSIYQAYISIIASLLVLTLIYQLLHSSEIRSVLSRGFYFLFFLILSLGAYYGITQVMMWIKGVEFNSYAASNVQFSISSLPRSICNAYIYFIKIFTGGAFGLAPVRTSRYAHILLLASVLGLIALWECRVKKENILHFLFLLALLILLPLAINCMFLFTSVDAIHTLVLYSFITFYVFAAIIADSFLQLPVALYVKDKCRRLLLELIPLTMAFIISINIFISNEAFLGLHLRYENAFSYYSSLIAEIKMMPEFDENSKLAIIGNYTSPVFYYHNLGDSANIAGFWGFTPTCKSEEAFLRYYMDFPIPFASDEEINQIKNSSEYASMNVYPYYGSVRMLGDIIVVKMS